ERLTFDSIPPQPSTTGQPCILYFFNYFTLIYIISRKSTLFSAHHDHIVRQTRIPKSIGLSDQYYYILVKTALSFGSFRQHYHWILSKFEVFPVLESFTEYSGLFVVLYFTAMHYY